MSENEVVPFSEIKSSNVDLNLVVEQGQKMASTLKSMGIKEATFDSGAYFNHNTDSNTTTLAADGVVMQQNEHSTTVVFRNENSTSEQALQEMSTGNVTQKTLGAFSGVSQQKASEILIESNS